jgi:hypothetical protein
VGWVGWVGGLDKVRLTDNARTDAWNWVAALIEGALRGPARQGFEIAPESVRRCLAADSMA